MNTKLPPTDSITLPEIMRRFPDEKSAIEYFESIRWINGVVCPHCGNNDQEKFWKLDANKEKKVRHGLRQCAVCKKQFRVTVGTIFEDSHVPLNLWIIAWYLICGAKKGMSALQLKRHLWGDNKGSYKTAWFMAHRIRHAMKDPIFTDKLQGDVEVDETYFGGKNTGQGRANRMKNKAAVIALVERGGRVRSQQVDRVTGANLKGAIKEHVMICSNVHTDDFASYRGLGPKFNHRVVKHSAKEYARKEKDVVVHTNTVEGYFSLLKRGVMGSFHHISKKHLPLYLAEFDFRYNPPQDHRRRAHGRRITQGRGQKIVDEPACRKTIKPKQARSHRKLLLLRKILFCPESKSPPSCSGTHTIQRQ